MSSNLFKAIKVGNANLQNRVVLAPLTRMRAPGHQVQDIQAKYYAQRGSRPGTLLITEATFISEAASGYPNAPGIYKQEHIDGWRKVFKAVHDNKSFIFVQLWALGRAATKADMDARGLPFVSSSAVADPTCNDGALPRALTKEEIKQYVKDYAQAAKNAIEAGADGIEIHGANGYLPDQFLHENTNTRTDEYGGSIENRARFTLEVVDAVIEAIGAEKTAIRISPFGVFGSMEVGVSPIPQFSYLVSEFQKRALAGKELAYLHVFENPPVNIPNYVYTELNHQNDFVRLIWKGPLILAGGYNAELAKERVAADDKTLIAMGRYFLSTPDIVNRWEKDIPLNPYHRDTFYTPGEVGYTDYPFAEEVSA